MLTSTIYMKEKEPMHYPATSTPPHMFPGQKPARKRRLFSRAFVIIPLIVAAIIIVSIVSFRATLQEYQVSGPAMQPTLRDGQTIWVNKLAYLLGQPQRGDVVVFNAVAPVDNICDLPLPIQTNIIVKRIVGIPGDTITNTSTSLSVNGQVLYTTTTGNNFAPISNLKLGNNQYFVLGDNQAVSLDSRCLGPIALNTIVGNVV